MYNNIFIGEKHYMGFWDGSSNINVRDNIFVYRNGSEFALGNDVTATHNLFIGCNWVAGEDCLTLEEVSGADVFMKDNGITTTSDYHFQTAYKQYESQYGIYAGTGFNDHQTAPVPYIVAKRIAEETDAAGQLKIQVRVKAGE